MAAAGKLPLSRWSGVRCSSHSPSSTQAAAMHSTPNDPTSTPKGGGASWAVSRPSAEQGSSGAATYMSTLPACLTRTGRLTCGCRWALATEILFAAEERPAGRMAGVMRVPGRGRRSAAQRLVVPPECRQAAPAPARRGSNEQRPAAKHEAAEQHAAAAGKGGKQRLAALQHSQRALLHRLPPCEAWHGPQQQQPVGCANEGGVHRQLAAAQKMEKESTA